MRAIEKHTFYTVRINYNEFGIFSSEQLARNFLDQINKSVSEPNRKALDRIAMDISIMKKIYSIFAIYEIDCITSEMFNEANNYLQCCINKLNFF